MHGDTGSIGENALFIFCIAVNAEGENQMRWNIVFRILIEMGSHWVAYLPAVAWLHKLRQPSGHCLGTAGKGYAVKKVLMLLAVPARS